MPVGLGDERDTAVHLMLKYYKHQSGLAFQYGGHESEGEADPIGLKSVIGLARMTFDGQGHYQLAAEDKSAFEAYIANERRVLDVSRSRRLAVSAGPERGREERASVAVAGSVVTVDRVPVRTRFGRLAGQLARS